MQTAKFGTNGNASTPTNNFEDNKYPNNNSIINSTRNFDIHGQNVESNYGNSDVGYNMLKSLLVRLQLANKSLN